MRAVLGLFVVSFLALGCNQPPGMKPPTKAPEVLVTPAIKETITDYEEFTGRTEAKIMVEVKARVTGYLNKVNFKDGDTVKEGDVLFEIEPRPYEVDHQKAEATLARARVRVSKLDADYRRATVLRQQGSISAEDFDKVSGERGEAQAEVNVAKADLEKAGVSLGYTKVKVPPLNNGSKPDPQNLRTARVGRRFKDPGNLIKADDTLLTTLVTLDPMFVYFDVDERTILSLRGLVQKKKIKSVRDMAFKFGLASDEGKYPYQGHINFEDNKLDVGTGTLQLRGEFKNDTGLSPGLFVRLRLYLGVPREAVLVPERALGTDQGQRFLYVVMKQTDAEGKEFTKAEYRGGNDLDLGALRDGWRVIEKGVQAGEMVIWSGLQRVRKDAPISPKKQNPPGLRR
jgi:RND family efflux transporter MFP subunit